MGHERCLASISSLDPDEMQRAPLPGVNPNRRPVSRLFGKRTALIWKGPVKATAVGEPCGNGAGGERSAEQRRDRRRR